MLLLSETLPLPRSRHALCGGRRLVGVRCTPEREQLSWTVQVPSPVGNPSPYGGQLGAGQEATLRFPVADQQKEKPRLPANTSLGYLFPT